MAIPIRTPRVNNNDDSVRLSHLYVALGASVRKGEPVAEIETDKATFTVEAEDEGFVIAVCGAVDETLDVGSVLMWLGATAEEAPPGEPSRGTGDAPEGTGKPTLKAMLLLAQHGLDAKQVVASGERLSVEDVERHVRTHGLERHSPSKTAPRSHVEAAPPMDGRRERMTPEERGMMRTVVWQREAATGYVELRYDPAPWEEYAKRYQRENKLMLSPLLALFAWRLARLGALHPKLNATIVEGDKYLYQDVNLGFTVQNGPVLYMAVVRKAGAMDENAFVSRLTLLQRNAMKNSLQPEESSGATIGFSSMARWKVTRHVPLLAPHTSLMIAHTAPVDGTACLGAAYDHRLLTGFDVVQALQGLSSPGEKDTEE